MAQRPNAGLGIVRAGRRVKTRRHFFISSGFNQIRKAFIDLVKVRRQYSVFGFQTADPAVSRRVRLRVSDHNRGLMHLRIVGLRGGGKVGVRNRYRIAVCIGARPCAENFIGHKKTSSDR